MNKIIKGLYAITPETSSTEQLLEKVRRAMVGGSRVIQYRNKSADQFTRLWQADALRSLTHAQGALLIINDSIELARATNADGVHLGKDDGDIALARKILPDRILGVSCYNDLDRAVEAEKAGADYVAFGAAFASSTKPDAVHAPLTLYRQASKLLSIPIVAIGGITIHNAKELIDAGADAIAVVSGLFDSEDIIDTAKHFSSLFQQTRP